VGNAPQSPPQQVQPPVYQPPHNPQSPEKAVISKSAVDKVADILTLTYFSIAFILLFRFVLSLVGANRESVFVEFIYQLSTPFMLPFLAMFGTPLGIQEYRLEMEVLVALLVYAVVIFGVVKLIRIIFR